MQITLRASSTEWRLLCTCSVCVCFTFVIVEFDLIIWKFWELNCDMNISRPIESKLKRQITNRMELCKRKKKSVTIK